MRLGYQARLYLFLGLAVFASIVLIGAVIGVLFLREASFPESRVEPPPSTANRAISAPPPSSAGPSASSTSASHPVPSAHTPRTGLGQLQHLTELEERIFEETNAERQQRGIRVLRPEEILRLIAREHSADMLTRNFFAHINPDGQTVGDRIAYGHRRLIGASGENIWRGTGVRTDSAAQMQTAARMIMDDWMNSPGHRENILRPEFSDLGVGISLDSDVVLVTQNFAVIQAYTEAAIPSGIRRGQPLNLRTTVIEAATDVERYDLWSPRNHQAVSHFPIGADRIDVRPGRYVLRFYFPASRQGFYNIFRGPEIIVN